MPYDPKVAPLRGKGHLQPIIYVTSAAGLTLKLSFNSDAQSARHTGIKIVCGVAVF